MTSTNFSRPRRPSEGQTVYRGPHTLSVVSERDEDLPSEPRFSYDSDRNVSRNDYDDAHGQDVYRRSQPLSVKDQRYPSIPNNNSSSGRAGGSKSTGQLPASLTRAGYCNPTMPVPDSPQLGLARRDSGRGSSTPSLVRSTQSSREGMVKTPTRPTSSSRKDSASTTSGSLAPSSTNSSSSTTTTRPSPSTRSNSTSTTESSKQQPFVPKSILKVTTVEQTSERSSSRSASAAGSNKSSDSGSVAVSYDSEGKFVASEYDTSELSEKEIKKLQKKGVNPALAMEMKALRKGKSFGNLMGNSYVS